MTDSAPPPEPDPAADDAVLAYVAAIETGRAAPETLPQPDQAAENLAGAEMMHDDEGDELAGQLGAWTPGSGANIERLQAGFVAGAADYGRRHNITYAGWRQAGVSPEVLEQAGIRPDEGQDA